MRGGGGGTCAGFFFHAEHVQIISAWLVSETTWAAASVQRNLRALGPQNRRTLGEPQPIGRN